MIDKIYIPTVKRVNNQITYNSLPNELKKKVVMVIQSWEMDQYNYDCEYLVLPDTVDYHYSNPFCIANTRMFIYKYAKNSKYCVFDDDLVFYRRNRKYMTGSSNMERSSRKCTHDDILEMFSLYSGWLDETSVTVAGCSYTDSPPAKKLHSNNSLVANAYWINGNDFSDEIDTWVLNDVSVAEDVKFILTLLSNGYGTRVSQEFSLYNTSVKKNSMESVIWSNRSLDSVHKDHENLVKSFPNSVTIPYDDEGNRVTGGYRGYGKMLTKYSKSFNKDRHTNIVLPKLKHKEIGSDK